MGMEQWDIWYNVTSILQHSASFDSVTGGTGNVHKGFTNEDCIIISGAPGRNFNINNSYQTEMI
jgi:hypothetical protein